MNFDQAINSDLICYGLKPFQFVVGRARNNQKYGVSSGERGLIDLDFMDGEILS